MTGKGDGNFRGGGAGGRDTACDRLSFDTQLSSPKPAVIAGIKVGDILAVAIDQQGPVQVVVIKHGNQIAGGITSPKMARLLECLRLGSTYQATVTSISGGQVSVRISP